MRHDDIETWKAMQGPAYEPSVDDPCIIKDCKSNSLTGCTKKGTCKLFTKKASKKRLMKKLAQLTTPPAVH